jgi:nucleoside-diphosphate-sugar epimerase
MTRFLITGAQGFVGRYLVAGLLRSDIDACILGLGRSPRNDYAFTHYINQRTEPIQAPLPRALEVLSYGSRYQYLLADINERAELSRCLRDFRPQTVVHLASALRGDPPEELFGINVSGIIRLIEAIAESGINKPRLIIGSTGGVYGIPARGMLPIKENAMCAPIDMYSISKLAAELASKVLSRQHCIPSIWARIFNLVGPGQDERHACGTFASTIAAIAKNEIPPLIEVGALDTTRDFLDVRDAARALLILIHKGAAGDTYNVGSGIETSIESVLATTLRAANLTGTVEIRRTKDRLQDIPRHCADIERLSALGFRPRYRLDRSIRDLFRYYMGSVSETNCKGEEV